VKCAREDWNEYLGSAKDGLRLYWQPNCYWSIKKDPVYGLSTEISNHITCFCYIFSIFGSLPSCRSARDKNENARKNRNPLKAFPLYPLVKKRFATIIINWHRRVCFLASAGSELRSLLHLLWGPFIDSVIRKMCSRCQPLFS